MVGVERKAAVFYIRNLNQFESGADAIQLCSEAHELECELHAQSRRILAQLAVSARYMPEVSLLKRPYDGRIVASRRMRQGNCCPAEKHRVLPSFAGRKAPVVYRERVARQRQI